MKNLPIVLFLMLTLFSARAQQVDHATVARALQEATSVFSDSNYQHIRMTYRFSYLDQPDKTEDSLVADYKTWKKCRWFSIDGTETLIHDSIKTILFRDDKLIWIGAAGKDQLDFGHVRSLDSLLRLDPAATCRMEKAGKDTWYHVSLHKVPGLKNMSFLVGGEGKLMQIKQVIDVRLLQDVSGVWDEGQGIQWAVVDLAVTSYANNDFNAADFVSNRYVVRQGQEWHPAPDYHDYKLFNASLKR